MTLSSRKRKRNLLTIETKLETKNQLAIRVSISFLAVRNNIGIVIQLSEKIDYLSHPWSQLVRIVGDLLYLSEQLRNASQHKVILVKLLRKYKMHKKNHANQTLYRLTQRNKTHKSMNNIFNFNYFSFFMF